jgi:hypothetical protein
MTAQGQAAGTILLARLPLRIKRRRTAAPPGWSAHGGEPDEIGLKPDIENWSSAFPAEAEVPWAWPEQPLIAKWRHSTIAMTIEKTIRA